MPYTKKSRTKKTSRRRPYRRRPRRALIRKSPMPLKFATKLRYVDNFTLDGAASGFATVKVFNAGGLYDPDTSGGGHQPRGFDQLMAMFDHYVVIGSRITVDIAASSVESQNQICGVALRDGATVAAAPVDYLELGTVRSRQMTPANPRAKFTLNYSPKRFLGRSSVMSDSTLKGSVGANPTESAYFHIFTAGQNSSDPAACTVFVTVDYLAVFIEPKDVTGS